MQVGGSIGFCGDLVVRILRIRYVVGRLGGSAEKWEKSYTPKIVGMPVGSVYLEVSENLVARGFSKSMVCWTRV